MSRSIAEKFGKTYQLITDRWQGQAVQVGVSLCSNLLKSLSVLRLNLLCKAVQFGADQHESNRQSLHDIIVSKWVKLTLNVCD